MTNSEAYLLTGGIVVAITGSIFWSMRKLERTKLFLVRTEVAENQGGRLVVKMTRPRFMWITGAILLCRLALLGLGDSILGSQTWACMLFIYMALQTYSEQATISKEGVLSSKGLWLTRSSRNIAYAEIAAVSLIPSNVFSKRSEDPLSSVAIRMTLSKKPFVILGGIALKDAQKVIEGMEEFGGPKLTQRNFESGSHEAPVSFIESKNGRIFLMITSAMAGIGLFFFLRGKR